ncbi:TM2 domain-containing membrane protein YozV [Bartonella fuyuanensis]|uniref:TM2 domain-containing membrane protein YozV n=1 Tax=Bartonella fuyuanensis TaxID=1460968 RepID=A0A840DZ98_9HYPH|nr:TM2 domain-containing protein [Bartonella fuyuanensis]MBB4076835.1 TM2 domain-containing membrane protein YozV [Bartonella fuyuanensis]
MKGVIISQDQGTYLVSGDDGKRYQFAIWDWLGKKSPRIGDTVDFVYEGGVVSSVFPLLRPGSEHSKIKFAMICWVTGIFGVHRFMVGKVWTGVLMLILSLSFFGLMITGIWAIVDFIVILAGKFTDKDGNQITEL